MRALQGPISQNLSSVTNDSFCYKLLKSLLLIGYQLTCHWFLTFVIENRLCETGPRRHPGTRVKKKQILYHSRHGHCEKLGNEISLLTVIQFPSLPTQQNAMPCRCSRQTMKQMWTDCHFEQDQLPSCYLDLNWHSWHRRSTTLARCLLIWTGLHIHVHVRPNVRNTGNHHKP